MLYIVSKNYTATLYIEFKAKKCVSPDYVMLNLSFPNFKDNNVMTENQIDFAVAIRAYNAADRLPDILDKLKIQEGIEEINWEIVIVDNNSKDNTAQIIADYQSNWKEKFPLKYFFEPRQGASIARRTAMEKTQGSLVGFWDDDNLPAPDWVAQAYAFGKSHPKAGAYGGQIHGEFETEPPPDFKKIAVYLAIIERGQKSFCYNQHQKKSSATRSWYCYF